MSLRNFTLTLLLLLTIPISFIGAVFAQITGCTNWFEVGGCTSIGSFFGALHFTFSLATVVTYPIAAIWIVSVTIAVGVEKLISKKENSEDSKDDRLILYIWILLICGVLLGFFGYSLITYFERLS